MANETGQKPFWETTSMEDMSLEQWESLCDGCARCCLMKLEDEDSGDVVFTNVGCTLLDGTSCRCMDYNRRSLKVEDCVQLTPKVVRELNWLPPTCAYKLIADGEPLYWWHPLVSGRPETVYEAGISVAGRVDTYEHELTELQDLEGHVVSWPIELPRKARHRKG